MSKAGLRKGVMVLLEDLELSTAYQNLRYSPLMGFLDKSIFEDLWTGPAFSRRLIRWSIPQTKGHITVHWCRFCGRPFRIRASNWLLIVLSYTLDWSTGVHDTAINQLFTRNQSAGYSKFGSRSPQSLFFLRWNIKQHFDQMNRNAFLLLSYKRHKELSSAR